MTRLDDRMLEYADLPLFRWALEQMPCTCWEVAAFIPGICERCLKLYYLEMEEPNEP